MTIFSAAFLLFLVIDPFGNIPFFLTALKHVEEKRQRKVVIRELLIALFVLVAFLGGGQYILRLLQISEPALTISGGAILFLIAIRMIFPKPGGVYQEAIDGEPFIVPLAVPYVAGPSAMASVLFIMNREPERWPEWLLAVLLAWFASAVIIFLASGFKKILKERGLIAMERLMGMVLITIAVQMLMNGIGEYFGKL